MPSNPLLKALPAALVLAAFSGCAAISPPEGYVKDSQQRRYDAKYWSPRGNVIAHASRSNEDRKATLQFWSDAVEYQKVDIDGMKLARRESITSAGGTEGVLFHFEEGEGQGKTAYLLALYVTPARIHTIEATGPADALAADMDKLVASMKSLR